MNDVVVVDDILRVQRRLVRALGLIEKTKLHLAFGGGRLDVQARAEQSRRSFDLRLRFLAAPGRLIDGLPRQPVAGRQRASEEGVIVTESGI